MIFHVKLKKQVQQKLSQIQLMTNPLTFLVIIKFQKQEVIK